MIRGEIVGALELIHFEIKTADAESDLLDLIRALDGLTIKAERKLLKLTIAKMETRPEPEEEK